MFTSYSNLFITKKDPVVGQFLLDGKNNMPIGFVKSIKRSATSLEITIIRSSNAKPERIIMRSYDVNKSIKKGISGAIRTAICGGGATAATGGGDFETVVATIVSAVAGFAFSALKNWLKNK